MHTKITTGRPVTLPCTSHLGTTIEFPAGTQMDLYKLADGTLQAREEGNPLTWAGTITREDIAEEQYDIDTIAHRIQTEALSDNALLMEWHYARGEDHYRVKVLRGACDGYPGQVSEWEVRPDATRDGKLSIILDGGTYTGPTYTEAD